MASDWLIIIFDTFKDNENGVMFGVTPAGTRTEGSMLNDGAVSNPSWNTFWDASTVCNDEGWFIEMRIPFSSLRFEERDGRTVMGMTVFRWIARKSEMDIFPNNETAIF